MNSQVFSEETPQLLIYTALKKLFFGLLKTVIC